MQQHIGNGWGFFIDIERYGCDFSKKQKVYICIAKPNPEIKKCKNSLQSFNMVKRVNTYIPKQVDIPKPVVVDVNIGVTIVPKPSLHDKNKKYKKIIDILFATLFVSTLLYIVVYW